MSKKLIFIFPGQASQYVGMGKDLHENSPAARKLLDGIASARDLSHIPDLCFNGPDELLTRTDNVQPAITLVSLMALAAIRAAGGAELKPSACAGHSLGEYAAHAAAGNLTFEQAVNLVKWRGRWMNEAAQPPYPPGAMVALMGLELADVKTLVANAGGENIGIANLNSPGQIIVSGEKRAVERLAESAKEAGAKRIVMLNVSGAWHSPLMKPAREKMATLLADEITPNKVGFKTRPVVVANVTGNVVKDVAEMRQTLTDQITSPVQWEVSVRRLINVVGGVTTEPETLPLFVEVGPGKVLKGLLRNIDRNLKVMNIENMDGVAKLVEANGKT
jgi:[acyl-carrier-protein] S-malonyltransferase